MTSSDRHAKDEEGERARQDKERRAMDPFHRLYGSEPRIASDGTTDQRSERRTGRVVQLPLRVHPRVKAIMLAIRKRDNIPSLVILLELMLDAYQRQYGALNEADVPSLEALVEKIERQRDQKDGA